MVHFILHVGMDLNLFIFVLLLLFTGLLQDVSAGKNPLKCSMNSKPCKDGLECVLYTHVCDGEQDCMDGSDEEDCETACKEDQFQCSHGKKCIDKGQVCDGVPQCQDRSDEVQCSKYSEGCAHRCDNNDRCLPEKFVCDGERDCLDGTDEENCEEQEDKHEWATTGTTTPYVSSQSTPIKCNLGSKPCKDRTDCVLYHHVCDGEKDCSDGSDEEECSVSCETDQFQCAHGMKCIEKNQVCDGVPQCQDRSDELECSKYMEGCAHQCDDKTRCIPINFLCDGERDCGDGSDEANCANEGCNAEEFNCTSGQCVAVTMRCDGHPDCWDHSDEESCTKEPVCTTKLRCPQSKECLVPEWRCDGEQDCKDGTDEKDCPVDVQTCGNFQWSCKSQTQCIPAAWRCDGAKDCDDGSDETDCGVVECLAHQFHCSSQECLEPDLVCNGIMNCADGSDEEGNCNVECTDADNSRCSQGCHSTPHGVRCLCAAGHRLMQDGVTCADIDECEGQSSGVCSHICINSPGSYQCDCHPGYVMEAGGHNCKITGEPYLLTSVQTDLYLFGLRSSSLDMLTSPAKKAILSLDYDWIEQKVFWVSLDTDGIRWSSLDQKATGTLVEGVQADSVAVDWLGRNLYWIDGVNSQIVAIKLTSKITKSLDHSVILDEDLDQPRSLALLPQKGLMFWTEIGNVVKIERAGMDGSERRAVVNSSLGWPGGVAVDALSDRVFWTDERLRLIGSATIDGDDLQILQMKETTNPFSLTVFNDLIYWTDAKRRVVQAANKVTGKNYRVLLKRQRQPFCVKIIHPMLQLNIQSPCKKMACSHLCTLAPGPKAVCKCPSGLLLAEDGLTCTSLVNSGFLLLLSPSTVTKIYLQARHTATELKGWPEHVALQVPYVNEAALMDYSLRERTLFLTDDGTTSLMSLKMKEIDLVSEKQLFKLVDDTITAMALDWVTNNIYWSSNKQPRLHVTFSGSYSAVVISEGIGRIESVALHPPSGRMCFNNLGLQETGTVATVECANMDGTKRLVVWKDAVKPTSLVFAINGETVYWADTNLGVIGSIKLDGSGYEELKVGDGLAAVALSEDLLLWMTVGDKTQLWYRDEQQNKLWFEVGTDVVSLKAFDKSSQSGSSACAINNGECQQLCLSIPGGRMCKCAHDHILVNTTHCGPEQSCPAGSRPCLDNLSCQSVERFCDGHVDCDDHSDENCKTQQSGVDVRAPANSHSTSTPPSLPQPTGLDTTVEVSGQALNLDAQQCSQTRCSGNGQCIETNGNIICECSTGYSGDSCQDKVSNTMQSPVVLGAVGAFAAVLVITIMAVVVKRRKDANARSARPSGRETSMTDMENKAAPSPNAPATPEEEAVSSVD